MNRRDFIKVSLVTAASVFSNSGFFQAAFNQPVELQVGGKLFRGMNDGSIFLSQDSGKTWTHQASFGDDISIMNLTADFTGQVFAQLAFKDFVFHLKLARDGKHWISI